MYKIIVGIGILGVLGYSLYKIQSIENIKTTQVKPGSLVTVVNQPSSGEVRDDNALDSNGGRIAQLDPVTGKLTSESNQETSEFSAKVANVQTQPVLIETNDSGVVIATLGDHVQIPLVATIDCDGELETEHSNKAESDTKPACGED